MILLAYRHGLRVSELVSLEWTQVELDQGRIHVNRLKNGSPSVHPLTVVEIRALCRVKREGSNGRFIFETERQGPMTSAGFRKMLTRVGVECGLPTVHPHQLRHAAGFALANKGVDTRSLQHYLGHKNIQHTVRYSELAADRFKDFWRD
jgi:type 1 fimbriae regulatory protein FimE